MCREERGRGVCGGCRAVCTTIERECVGEGEEGEKGRGKRI